MKLKHVFTRPAPPHSGPFLLFGVPASDLFRSQVIIGNCFCQNFSVSRRAFRQLLPASSIHSDEDFIIIKYYSVLFLPYLHLSRRSWFWSGKMEVANLLLSAMIIAKFYGTCQNHHGNHCREVQLVGLIESFQWKAILNHIPTRTSPTSQKKIYPKWSRTNISTSKAHDWMIHWSVGLGFRVWVH
jgi:hypothetical protein